MLGALLSLAVAVGAVGLGRLLVGRWIAEFDPAARFGLAGLVGLGSLGWITFFLGILPGGFRWGVFVIGALAVLGLATVVRGGPGELKFRLPQGAMLLAAIAVGAALLFPLVGALAPSDTMDWDSLAYHLAIPKMWLAAGQMTFVSFIHHSNFPLVVDNLFLWGLKWGDQTGAKMFSVAYLALGLCALFGLARQRYGAAAGWWAAIAFAGIPVVLWLSGTAYIDVAHGLFAGLGLLFAAASLEAGQQNERRWPILGAIMLGFAAGSKFTGLQTIFVVCAVVGLFGFFALRQPAWAIKRIATLAAISLAIAAPWYVRNVVNTGNPVYPFFYGAFGGKNWDEFSGRIYTEEQKTFGITKEGKMDPTAIGAATLGLAYQPGRYINPNPRAGTGLPTGAMGAAILAVAVFWATSGRLRRYEGAVLAGVGVSLLLWFVLSQQSRYIVSQAVPLAVLAGGAVAALPLGRLLAGLLSLQAVYSFGLLYVALFQAQLQVVTGKVSREEFLAQRVGFYEPAMALNLAVKDGKVALYDEVFGYFLDVPYFWANPGHTTELGYAEMQTADDLIAAYRRLGITHVYLNFAIYNRQDPTFLRWAAAMGLQGAPVPYEGQERADMSADIRNKWKVLVADAIREGKLVRTQDFRNSVLLTVEGAPEGPNPAG